MATPLNDIYELFGSKVALADFVCKQTDDKTYKDFYFWLQDSIGTYGDYAYADLNISVPFSRQIYQFAGDGVQTIFTLNPAPQTNAIFYVEVDNTVLSESSYSFNVGTSEITFNTAPNSPTDTEFNIYIGTYIIGEITGNLNAQEKQILSEGMIVPYTKEKLNRESLLFQKVYSRDLGVHSQAQHIKSINDVLSRQIRETDQRIMMYSYKQDPDDLDLLKG